MAIFIDFPWLAAIPGLVLIGLARWRRSRVAAVAGGMWLLYAGYETGMKLRWLCSGDCNIRIDLLVIYPVLVVLSLLGLLAMLRGAPRAAD
jgi:hypothetical protein